MKWSVQQTLSGDWCISMNWCPLFNINEREMSTSWEVGVGSVARRHNERRKKKSINESFTKIYDFFYDWSGLQSEETKNIYSCVEMEIKSKCVCCGSGILLWR